MRQRCVYGTRIIISEELYEDFKMYHLSRYHFFFSHISVNHIVWLAIFYTESDVIFHFLLTSM